MKFSKCKLLLSFLAIPLLISCSNELKFSKGYQYDIELLPVEIAYHLDKDEFEYGEPVTIHISYGHSGVTDSIPNEKKNLPFCLFLDYGNTFIGDENDYREYNGYKLIEEVDSKDFWTDEYAYFQEGYGSKTFSHTIEFDIPFNYFEYVYYSRPYSTVMEIIAGQLYKNENNEICMYEIRSAEIDLYFSFKQDEKKIKINF